MKTITELPEWHALEAHQKRIAPIHMKTWFAENPARYADMSLQVDDILLDYSKNRLTSETLQLLGNLARALKLKEKIAALFSGATVNTTENRPALHTALRNRASTPVFVGTTNIMPEIALALEKMRVFTTQVRAGLWLGATGKPMTDIVNVGIGGSHLGPLLATHALANFAIDSLRCHFISNIDSTHVHEVLKQINPETTLFIISSKSFSTLETTTNTNTIKKWLCDKLGTAQVAQHFVAVTAAVDTAMAFGIPATQIFPVWDWIGGRYSIWSAIGLPLALLTGMDNFLSFLQGAYAMDEHFRHADFAHNMPVIMALTGIWYINFFAANNHAIVPYSHHLTHLRAYLQQADMESNGKSMSHLSTAVEYATGPIIWGEQGCNAQHAFLQLLHQGQHLIPVDFILAGNQHPGFDHHQDILFASGISQAQALMHGKSYEQAFAEALSSGHSETSAHALAQHQKMPGNRPSNILFLRQLTPHSLGALLALYEHKIYVQGAIWQINSFDQWGVALGKQMLPTILAALQSDQASTQHDSSTQGLIQHYKKLREPV